MAQSQAIKQKQSWKSLECSIELKKPTVKLFFWLHNMMSPHDWWKGTVKNTFFNVSLFQITKYMKLL